MCGELRKDKVALQYDKSVRCRRGKITLEQAIKRREGVEV